jgi:fatty acid desaturase
MARRAILRASDADREQVAERLRHATAEGRLLAEELEQRLGAAFSARSYGELDALVADLPNPPVARRRQLPMRPWVAVALALIVATGLPLLLMALAAVLFVLSGVIAMLGFWMVLAWWCFGHRREYPGARYKRSLHAYSRWRA